MKLIYCTHSICNPGGMERVLLNKVHYLKRHTDWEIAIVTTDQHGRTPFYPLPDGVRHVDLDINYSDDNASGILHKITGYIRRRRLHRHRLTDFLMKEQSDIVVSLFPSESSFIPSIADGSRKVLELHFCKFFRRQYGRSGLMGMIDRMRTLADERLVRRFDAFVVLTNEDSGYWGNLPNIHVIPNAAIPLSDKTADCTARRVIAVGRLDFQKGFDRLLQAWHIIQQSGKFADWHLDIFGQGEWHDMLQQMIADFGITDTTSIHRPTTDIGSEYTDSSFIVMSSHYEGLPMVMIEAMALGLPAVSFDFKCGPKDIISDGINGLTVTEGDVKALADAMMQLMADEQLRRHMGQNAKSMASNFSEDAIMTKWIKLFTSLVPKQ